MLSTGSCRNRAAIALASGVAIVLLSSIVLARRGSEGWTSADELLKQSLTTPGAVSAGAEGPVTCSGDATNLLYPLDGTFVLVDFFGDGPTGSGPAQGPDQHNDDDSATVVLPFMFDLYGDLHGTAFVNNNGNLSFGAPFSTFTATGFPVAGFPLVAPFWGDVDTGNPTNFVGEVYQTFVDSGPPAGLDTLVVTWDNVGYFNENGDLRNTFQVAISDGTNPVIGLGNNVAFSYDNMCWTTGDASGGVGGFGGVPATVGANRGNGVEFFQIGRFDHEGTDYDGPFGNPDGVSFLDGQTITFNTSTTTKNIDPVPTNFPPGNTIAVDCVTEVLDLDLQFLSPEEEQTTTVTIVDVDGAQAAGLSITNTPGNVATVELDWVPDPDDVGIYVLDFTATDDFIPPGVTEISLTIEIFCSFPDCNDNGIPDDLDISEGDSLDCNENGIPDECDIDPLDPDGDGLVSPDCNANEIPDECEPDCNDNGIPDDCDIDPSDPDGNEEVSPDCNDNGIPDECDIDPSDPDGNEEVSPDCNGNGIPDECDIADGTSEDCNGNGIPDECDIASGESDDINENGVPDECDPDCNDNGIPDDVDIASGESTDGNGNGIPDECELEPGFEEPMSTQAAGAGNFEAVGDFDDDGTTDLAIIIPNDDPTMAGVVQVFLNLGTNEGGAWQGFMATDPVLVGLSPSGIAVGLLDADDLPDVAVTNAGENTVSILLNLGLDAGVWLGLELFDTVPVGNNPSSVAAADLTEDGFIDLVLTETEIPLGLGSGSVHLPNLGRAIDELLGTGGEGVVRLLINDGDAGMGDAGTSPTGGAAPRGLETDPADEDKCPDVMGINTMGFGGLGEGGEPGNVFVLLNQGGGVFGPPLTFEIGQNPTDLATGDLDQDGLIDIAATNGADGTVSVLLNQGSGGGESGTGLFAVVDVLTVGSDPRSVEMADLDGDEDLDFAVAAEDPIIGPAVQTLQNLLEPGDPLAEGVEGGTTLAFGPPASFSVEADPQFVVSANLNGDDIIDLATVNVDADEPTGGSVTGLVSAPEPIALPVHLDIKPGSCPNSFNRTSQGYVSVALVGNKDLDVLQIDLTTIELTRLDGIGGIVAPHEGPPGPHSVFDDVATPFGDPAATDCGCDDSLGDGPLDLVMKFRRPTLVSVLKLNEFPLSVGDFVPLKVRGNLLEDGIPFEAIDCIRLVGHESTGPVSGME